MIGRGGTRRATVLNPARAKVEAKPVLEALGVSSASPFGTQQTGVRKHTFTGSIEVGKLATERTIRVFATRLNLPEYGGAIRRN